MATHIDVEGPPADASAEATTMSAGEAFGVLGDETRLHILQTLGAADAPLSFSALFDRVDYEDSSNFNYHLQELVGHFVTKTDEGYALRQAGGRIVQAILSGVVTDYPVIERTPTETPCFLCGGRMDMSYRQEVVALYCADCGGTRDTSAPSGEGLLEEASDFVGGLGLPPSGIRSRDPADLPRAAEVWTVSKGQAVARDVCPHCAAPLEDSVRVCEDHEVGEGRCDACERQFAAVIHVNCTNCILERSSIFTSRLLSAPELMAFMLDHGIDPMAPEGFHLSGFDEEIRSVDPFEASFTFTAGDDSISLTVDDDLSVVAVDGDVASG